MGFEWDESKNEENRKKHHVSFEEAQEAFMDPGRILLEDPKHSTADERRLYVLASVAGRVMDDGPFHHARREHPHHRRRLLASGEKAL